MENKYFCAAVRMKPTEHVETNPATSEKDGFIGVGMLERESGVVQIERKMLQQMIDALSVRAVSTLVMEIPVLCVATGSRVSSPLARRSSRSHSNRSASLIRFSSWQNLLLFLMRSPQRIKPKGIIETMRLRKAIRLHAHGTPSLLNMGFAASGRTAPKILLVQLAAD